jgi:roadblock/LC7 domain-containing protein
MKSMFHRLVAIFAGIATGTMMMSVAAFAQYVAPDYEPTNTAGWVLQKGDWIIANVENNTLQFVRENYSDISQEVEIGSGINNGKKMNYLGMRYNPATPEDVWEIRSKHEQTWWSVFGSKEAKGQLFFRLYRVEGENRVYSHYGIHTTPEVETIFAEQDGFGSWGCLLTRYDLLKMVDDLYELNEEVVRVVTTKQTPREVVALLEAF